ncbi:TRAP transporter substrate-binding protein [Rubrimonas cliftonensis]|uniref:TRAP-type mannitol/chloroaromatic compound transport system, substrate-binding protein n=1 Tax=Rubrimonas cliftonensis TaxID=89524 RepID=A0A1H3W1Y8_9RHOB|nr:TRAP transporter substrate-binding protein [Rubrimonas cliftonensis]SDZ80990.1 TRAP-type mannitol/chloroaromatic compound transport system, substrate-binding protein [Rubrimonas cliftonensis]
MDRRSFLKAGAVGAAASGALAAPAVLAQDKQVVRMVTTWPRNFPGLGTGAQRVADRITAVSGGRIEVKLFAAGELVPAFECFDAVATGAAEMYHGADYYWQGKHKGYNFFTAVPMGFTAQELQGWVHYGGGQELWDELGRNFGVKGFLAGNTGVQYGGWFRNPIMSLDDMKGLKMRMPGLGGEVLRQIGANAVALPGGEIFPALQAGTIDATEWVGPYNDMAFGFQNILKNYMYPGFHEPGSGLAVGMNLGWWEGLDAADQALIGACCTAENDVMMAEYTANNGPALDRLINEHGVTLHQFPDDVFKQIADASENVVAATAEDDDIGRRIYESYAAFRKLVAPVTQVSEEAYTMARAKALDL